MVGTGIHVYIKALFLIKIEGLYFNSVRHIVHQQGKALGSCAIFGSVKPGLTFITCYKSLIELILDRTAG